MRPEFVPSLQYRLAARFKRVGGVIYKKGDLLDLSRVSERVARRMYNLRQIELVEEGVAAPAPSSDSADTDTGAASSVEAEAQALVDANTKDQLLLMGANVEGVSASQTKLEIALAIVKAGRGTP